MKGMVHVLLMIRIFSCINEIWKFMLTTPKTCPSYACRRASSGSASLRESSNASHRCISWSSQMSVYGVSRIQARVAAEHLVETSTARSSESVSGNPACRQALHNRRSLRICCWRCHTDGIASGMGPIGRRWMLRAKSGRAHLAGEVKGSKYFWRIEKQPSGCLWLHFKCCWRRWVDQKHRLHARHVASYTYLRSSEKTWCFLHRWAWRPCTEEKLPTHKWHAKTLRSATSSSAGIWSNQLQSAGNHHTRRTKEGSSVRWSWSHWTNDSASSTGSCEKPEDSCWRSQSMACLMAWHQGEPEAAWSSAVILVFGGDTATVCPCFNKFTKPLNSSWCASLLDGQDGWREGDT